MHGIYELKEMLCKELEEYGKKGELTTGSLDVVDKLAHSIKNLDKIIEAYEEEGEGSYAYMDGRGGSYADGRGGSYNMGGGSYRTSYARGRGSNARRDSMGRYSRRGGYSRADGAQDMVMELRGMMDDAPTEKVRRRIEELISDIEGA